MHVRWRLTKARHAAISFEVVEWSEQLRSVTSAWLGAVRRSVQVRLCTSGCKSEKMFGVISPPRDLLLSILFILIVRTVIVQCVVAAGVPGLQVQLARCVQLYTAMTVMYPGARAAWPNALCDLYL